MACVRVVSDAANGTQPVAWQITESADVAAVQMPAQPLHSDISFAAARPADRHQTAGASTSRNQRWKYGRSIRRGHPERRLDRFGHLPPAGSRGESSEGPVDLSDTTADGVSRRVLGTY